MTKKEFNKLTIQERYLHLKKEGDYIGSKKRESYFMHLFALHGHYVEMWRTLSENQIQWIEITDNKDCLSEYVKDIDLP